MSSGHPLQRFLIACRASDHVDASVDAMGFKAYNLWRMHAVGLPVPQAFVLGTGYCRDYFARGGSRPADLRDTLVALVRELERSSVLAFGSPRKPLLVSVRSGAPVSMPGMLDTVLNVGLCESTVAGLLRLTGNPRLVWDNYRRLVQSFAEIVHGVCAQPFEAALSACIRDHGAADVDELDFQDLRSLTRRYLDVFEELIGSPFPQQPLEQLESAVVAVWSSWSNDKAVQYRRINGLPDDLGTAVTVQRMVYGNAGGTSGAGVAFTRDPGSGEPTLYLDFLFNAQGEDVVSGRRSANDADRLAMSMPGVFEGIRHVARTLEAEFRDMQEFEFTVQDGTLYILQTRVGKRTAWAALRIAVDQCEQGLIDASTAVQRLAGYELERIERIRAVASDDTPLLAHGTPAGIGVACGEIALDSARATAVRRAGRPAILVRETTSTDDIGGIEASSGILTATGSRTSHAAVIARQFDRPCVVGCVALRVDLARRRCSIGGRQFAEGDSLSIDGHTGAIHAGMVRLEIERPTEYLDRLRSLSPRRCSSG